MTSTLVVPERDYLLIGELAASAQVTKDTVRHYDQLGLLMARNREAGTRHYREYHPDCVARIAQIKDAQAIGFTLTEIQNCLHDYNNGNIDLDRQLAIVKQKLAQIRQQQSSINQMVATLCERIVALEAMKQDQVEPQAHHQHEQHQQLDTTHHT